MLVASPGELRGWHDLHAQIHYISDHPQWLPELCEVVHREGGSFALEDGEEAQLLEQAKALASFLGADQGKDDQQPGSSWRIADTGHEEFGEEVPGAALADDARMVGDEGNEHLCIHHLDAIVAHHEMGDQHHDDDVELPPSMFSGSGNANTAAAAGVGGVAAVVAAGLAGGAPVDALCRV